MRYPLLNVGPDRSSPRGRPRQVVLSVHSQLRPVIAHLRHHGKNVIRSVSVATMLGLAACEPSPLDPIVLVVPEPAVVPTQGGVADEAFSKLSLGWSYSCGLLGSGSVSCWGDGFLGRPDLQGTDYAQIDAGPYSFCALTTSGALSCWSALDPTQWTPPASGSFTQVSVFNHGCAVRSDGSLVCWGPNSDSQASPPGGTDFTQVAAGQFHSCAIRVDGGLACWGRNDLGQATPPAGGGFVSVTAGESHTCALRENGSLRCWGSDWSGEVSGAGGQASAVVERPGPYSQVEAGWHHTCAVRVDSSLECWGSGTDINAPTGTGFIQVSGGVTHTCALRTDGSAQCWGSDSRGESTPPDVPTDARFETQVAYLVDAGILTAGAGSGLVQELYAALSLIERGRLCLNLQSPCFTDEALRMIDSILDRIEMFEQAGVLSHTQAQALIELAVATRDAALG